MCATCVVFGKFTFVWPAHQAFLITLSLLLNASYKITMANMIVGSYVLLVLMAFANAKYMKNVIILYKFLYFNLEPIQLQQNQIKSTISLIRSTICNMIR